MADVVTIGVLVAVLVIILMGLLFAKSQGKGDKDSKNRNRRAAVPTRDEDGQIVGAPAASVGPRGRRGGPRMRRTVQVQEELEDNQVEAAEDDGEGDNEVLENKPGKIGRKKLEKLQAKADKKKEREFLEREREERKKQREKEDEEAQKLAEKEKAEEERLEEEARKRKEEKERKEHEEYLKLKASFDVQEEGFDEEEDDDSEDKLQSFIQYIKETKVVMLEDLAAHFKLKAQDCIDRVTQLSEEGRLTGVLDDRGKFIYISQEELESIAKFIKQRGRISISDLAENSNQLITLKN